MFAKKGGGGLCLFVRRKILLWRKAADLRFADGELIWRKRLFTQSFRAS